MTSGKRSGFGREEEKMDFPHHFSILKEEHHHNFHSDMIYFQEFLENS